MLGLSELEHLLEQATKEPGWRPAFYRHLLDAEIWALVSAPTLRGSGTLPAGTRLALAHLLRGDGTWVAPFFTSPARIQQRALQVSHCVAMTGREFFEATRGSPLHLNPNCEFGREFVPWEIEALLKHGSLCVTPDHESLSVGRLVQWEPLDDLPPMVESLRILYATHPNVSAAYLVKYQCPDQPRRSSWLIGVVAAYFDEMIFRDTATVLLDCDPGAAVDAIPLDVADGAIGQAISDRALPFYHRVDALH